ncbi:MAG: fibronectin type III domain-containing protein [Campylobacter sp.]|nr:fibronectin type III domain-containing protein [Campylobacter sp.]
MKKFHLSFCSLYLILLLNACGATASGLTTSKEVLLNESLPKIEKLKSISDMSNAAFEWEPLYNENISGFYLYRSSEENPEFKLVGTIKNKFQTHYVDTKLEPGTKYRYMMKSFNDQNHISEEGVIIEVTTAPRIEPVPFIQAITNLPNRIKLIWRPHPDLRVDSYRVERAKMEENNFKTLAKLKNRLNAEYIDTDMKADESFNYRVIAISFDGIESEPSETISSTSKALPSQIEGLNASMNLSNKIELNWNASNDKDFSYYKVYSTSSSLLPYSVLAKTSSNHYEDLVSGAEKSKYYKVTQVDKDGLESPMPKESVEGKTLGLPAAPSIILAQSTNDGINLEWTDNDDRASEYIIKRYGGDSPVIYKGVKEKRLKDIKALPGVEYHYEIISVDSAGLQSEPSKRVKAAE